MKASSAESTLPPPTISLIVAAYNIQDYIGACLSSLLDNHATDYEIIVVDDGSTDETPQRIEAAAGDSRLRHVRRDNGGLGAARNTGIDNARGRYIQFVDGDDWLAPNSMDICLAAIRAKPQADLFVFDYLDIREDRTVRRRCGANFWAARNAAWNKIYARELIGETRFDTDILYEDLARTRPWVASAQAPAHIPEALYYYRNSRPGSIMNSREIGRFYELFTAAERCVDRIQAEAMHDAGITARLGGDWFRRFYTGDVFVPGIIYWTQQIPDSTRRHDYIARFMAGLPDTDLPSISHLARDFGPKIALIGQCYKRGAYTLGDFLLHDLRRYRLAATRRLPSLRKSS